MRVLSDRTCAAASSKSRVRRNWHMIALDNLVQSVRAIPTPANVAHSIEQHFDAYSSGGWFDTDFASALYDPKCCDLSALPPSVLAARELPLPQALALDASIPIAELNRKLIHAGEDMLLIAVVAETLQKFGIPQSIYNHSACLSALRSSHLSLDRAFFLKVMCGHHRSALLHLRDFGPPSSLSMNEALELILMQTLLFNARDLQINAALIHQAIKQPVFGLVPKVETYIRSSGVRAIFRDPALFASTAFAEYLRPISVGAGADQKLVGRAKGLRYRNGSDPLFSRGIENFMTQRVNARVQKIAVVDKLRIRQRNDELVPYLKEQLEGQDGFLPIIPPKILGISINGRRKYFPTQNTLAVAIRYSGLTPVECTAASVSRFVQSIVCLRQVFDQIVDQYERTGKLVARGAEGIPGYNTQKLPWGAQTKIRVMVDHYRRSIVGDSAFGCKSGRTESVDDTDRQGEKQIKEVEAWLTFLGARELGDHKGDIDSERRTYHLLDVLPEVRLSR